MKKPTKATTYPRPTIADDDELREAQERQDVVRARKNELSRRYRARQKALRAQGVPLGQGDYVQALLDGEEPALEGAAGPVATDAELAQLRREYQLAERAMETEQTHLARAWERSGRRMGAEMADEHGALVLEARPHVEALVALGAKLARVRDYGAAELRAADTHSAVGGFYSALGAPMGLPLGSLRGWLDRFTEFYASS